MKFPGDPYETEYAEIVDIEICREGVWNGWDWTPEMLEEIAASYDIKLLRAPLQRTHWGDGGGLVLGHILKPYMKDEGGDMGVVSLFAKVGILTEGVELIQDGQVNERSVSISSWYPTQGLWYLCHLMLISDTNPAVSGMEPIRFSGEIIDEDRSESVIKDPEYAFALSYQPQNLNWSKEEGDIKFRVRESSRFQNGTLTIRAVNREQGIRAEVGELKSEYLPEGKDSKSLFTRYYLFAIEKEWNLPKAKEWIQNKKTLTAEFIEPDPNLEIKTIAEIPNQINKEVNKSTNQAAASRAEGGIDMPDTEVEKTATGADGKIETTPNTTTTPTAAAEIKEPEKLASPEVIRVQDKSVFDVRNQNQELLRTKEEADSRTYEALLSENEALQKKITENDRAFYGSTLRTLLTQGYIAPVQMKMGLEDVLIAASKTLIKVLSEAGIETEENLADRIVKILQVHGKMYLKGEVVTYDELDEGVDDDLAKQKSLGADTKLAESVEKLKRKYPNKGQFELLQVAYNQNKGRS